VYGIAPENISAILCSSNRGNKTTQSTTQKEENLRKEGIWSWSIPLSPFH